MDCITQKMFGDRLQVSTYIDPDTFQKLEAMRGDVSRSRYVGKILMKALQ
jgi:hypothetical protein